ncbi:hypothetical protein [uncultured Kordia sp.]|uniref:hypothetical protein n=1 Tax=uncultured Kordia sp. TaxID=507699 RepID=UPI002601A28E|nr:hypothetical protein [uncultured Kordia sp.]
MTFHEKLENYFDSILQFNWKTFNTLNVREQASDWKSLFDEFDRIIREEHELNGINFQKTTAMIQMYSKQFRELPIQSSLYTVINSRFITSRLYDMIRNLAFEEALKKSNAHCDCELRHKFGRKPITKHLKEIKVLYDGYYNPSLLECSNCSFQWISYAADDSTGATVYEKYQD